MNKTDTTLKNQAKRIKHASGSVKTPCVGTILNYFGIPQASYKYTWNGKANVWAGILRRNGYSVRSRKSQLPKNATVGKARFSVAKISQSDPCGAKYIIAIDGHVLLLDSDGSTLIDTAPRKRDRRKVVSIVAVFVD